MKIVYRLVKEIDGKVINSGVLSKNDLGLVMGAIFYAKTKDYYKPRVDSYSVVYKKIKAILEGVKR